MSFEDAHIAIETDISEIKGLTPAAKWLWTVLADHRNRHTGECFPSIETLSKETG